MTRLALVTALAVLLAACSTTPRTPPANAPAAALPDGIQPDNARLPFVEKPPGLRGAL